MVVFDFPYRRCPRGEVVGPSVAVVEEDQIVADHPGQADRLGGGGGRITHRPGHPPLAAPLVVDVGVTLLVVGRRVAEGDEDIPVGPGDGVGVAPVHRQLADPGVQVVGTLYSQR